MEISRGKTGGRVRGRGTPGLPSVEVSYRMEDHKGEVYGSLTSLFALIIPITFPSML